jgi:FkbM family methyltransferase
MGLLKTIRKNVFINRALRSILKSMYFRFNQAMPNLIKRWPVSGIVDCEFKNVKFKLYSQCDDGFPYYFYYGFKYHEDADLKLFMDLSKFSNCILDIGANSGLFSLLAAKANQNARIYAFEPYSANAERLALNLSINQVHNVEILKEAIGDKVGEIEISVPKNNSISDVSSANIEFSKTVYPDVEWLMKNVAMNTVDNFRTTLSQAIDLIKCDVETFEMSVFNGALEVLKHDKPTILFECFLDEARVSFFNHILKEYHYYLYLVLEQGLVYSREGFVDVKYGLNYLITPIAPIRTFISYNEKEALKNALLLRAA